MSESPSCPKCGAELSAAGLCAACAADFLQGEPTAVPGEPFVPPTVAELAEKFPQWEILALVGQGGMGAVYQVRQRELDRVVALKILPPGIGGDPAFAERFTREARALAKLSHPNIVTLFEFGRAGGGPYFFLMEFVDGLNLRQLLRAERVSPREALEIVPQICDALQFAHDHGIVHRDIKPENILLDRRGRVKVADFGLAKLLGSGAEAAGEGGGAALELTGAGEVLGTPSYMAPEQTERPDAVDHRADIYALGVVFYQMLTGELPGRALEPPSRKVRIDVRLDEVVLRALEKNPDRRYAQASAMKTEVEAAREPRRARRISAGWLAAILVLLLVLAGGAFLKVRNDRNRRVLEDVSQAIRLALAAEDIRYDQLEVRASGDGFDSLVTGPKKKFQEMDGRNVLAPLAGKLVVRRTENGWTVRGTDGLSGIAVTRTGADTIFGRAANGLPVAASPSPPASDPRSRLLALELTASSLRPGRTAANPQRKEAEDAVREFETRHPGLRDQAFRDLAKEKLAALTAEDAELAGLYQATHPRRLELKAKIGAAAALAAAPSRDAEAAAEKWLAGIDAGAYAESWTTASPAFRAAVPQAGWILDLQLARAPLGALEKRTLRAAVRRSGLPGAPPGEYVVMTFDAVFARERAAVETVTFSLEPGPQWRASGYFIK